MKDIDDKSFEEIVEEYTPLLFNFIAKIAGRDNASDLIQETFIKIWKNLKRFNPKKASLKTWIFTIARNTAIDFLKKKKSLVFSELEDEEIENLEEESPLPDEVFETKENRELLKNLLEDLPANYKILILLYYEEEMTFEEIAKIMNRPLNTIKSWKRRAIFELKNSILGGNN
ncbi:MAG: RNA polymerase sigma factor [Candidatus Paceibacterota bacterium]|jgi:RNA polymerase sigma-70 factor (ECF subfamily)